MDRYLLIGPLSRDRIIRGGSVTVRAGGAVYYYSRVLSKLNVKHTAAITVADSDRALLEEFPPETDIFPIKKRETVEFENIYFDGDSSKRIQRSNFSENPITVNEIGDLISERWTGVLLGPLLPTDIPIGTLEFISKNQKVHIGLQGYLRFRDGKTVKPGFNRDIYRIIKYADTVFLDENESRVIALRPPEALIKIGGHVDEAVITCGDRGSLIYHQGAITRIRAVEASAELEPTGLGDTYMAAYIYRRKSADVKNAGEYASYMATKKLEGKI